MAKKKDVEELYNNVIEGFAKWKKKSVPNYKTMCEILKEPDYSNKTSKKDKQFKYWKLCFSWKMEKRKFTRIKIYNKEDFLIKLKEFQEKEEELSQKEKRKNLQEKVSNYKLNYLLLGKSPSCPISWSKRGVYLIYNNNINNSYKQKTCYVGSTTISFMSRFDRHLYQKNGQSKKVVELIQEKDTHVTFLWFAKEDDSEEFIHEKESEFWALYKKKGYYMINSHISEYHKSVKNTKHKYIKKNYSNFKEKFLQDKNWLTYKAIEVKIPAELQPILIEFLRDKLKLEYSNEYNLWTLPEMVKLITDFEQNKNKEEDKLDG